MWQGEFWSSGMWIFPLLMMIIMLIIVSRIFGPGNFRSPWGQGGDKHKGEEASEETPMELLKKRYAKGEIGKDEFDQMKKDLLG